MNREDWLDYFEAINGRTASEEEIAQALRNGEFQDKTVISSNSDILDIVEEVEKPKVESSTEENTYVHPVSSTDNDRQQDYRQATQQPFTNIVQNPNVNELKTKGLNYFNWLVTNLKSPMENREVNHLYTIITIALASLFGGFAIVNTVTRTIMTFVNAVIDGKTLSTAVPELYDRIKISLNNQFGISKIIVFSLLVLVINLGMIYLPLLFKSFRKESAGFGFNKIEESVSPLILVLNVLATAVTFLIPYNITVSSSIGSSLNYLFSYSNLNSMISEFLNLLKKVPALESIKDVFVYLTVLFVISFLVLLVNFIKQVEHKFGKINSFYVTLISILVIILLVLFINKTIYSQILESVNNLYKTMTSN